MKKLSVVSYQLVKRKATILLFSIFLISSFSCQKIFIDEDVANNPQSNFNYLWNDIKNRYSYLDYKNIDWNKVYDTLAPKVHDGMSNEALFNVLGTMMNILR